MKQKFKKQFAKRVFTRFHMTLILAGTVLSGVVFSKIFIFAGLDHIIVRSILVLLLAYVCFFILMKLWLHYLTEPYRKSRLAENLMDAADAMTSISDVPSTGSAPNLTGHGGNFGGGGASGAWADADSMTETASTVDACASEAAGEAVSGIADEGGIVLIPLIICLVVLFGSGLYLIYEAPVIISEAAFELILASSLIKKARSIDNPNWIGSIFRATWPAFVLTLFITVLAGLVLMTFCPQAGKITDAFRLCIECPGPTGHAVDRTDHAPLKFVERAWCAKTGVVDASVSRSTRTSAFRCFSQCDAAACGVRCRGHLWSEHGWTACGLSARWRICIGMGCGVLKLEDRVRSISRPWGRIWVV